MILKHLQNRTMYPKVKVREQEQDYEETYEINYLQSFDSLSLYQFSSSVKESEDDSPPPTVRIPQSHISNSGAPTYSNKNVLEEDKPNIRASPIPRPRAVLSSPDNDSKIRSKNKKIAERNSALKNHNLCQNRHLQCKVTTSPIAAAESPINARRESKTAAADSKTDLRGTKAPVSRNTYLRKGKPHFIQS